MRRVLVAIAAALLFGPVAQADDKADAQALLEKCVQSGGRKAVGVEELEKSCPGLWRAIDTLGDAAFISNDQYESLDRNGVADLIELHERFEEQAVPSAQGPDTAALAPILKGIAEPVIEKKLSKWDKFVEWLKERLNRKSDDGQESWLNRWLKQEHLSERASKIIGYVIIGFMGLLALAVVVNELRAAGVFKRRRKSAEGEAADEENGELPANVREALEEVPLVDQPTLLLRMLIGKLVAAGRLTRERSLTHRELSQRANFDSIEDRSAFEQVARLSEEAIYGEIPLDSQAAEPVLSRGRALYDTLLAKGAVSAS